MDQADTGEEASPLFHAVSHQGALLGHHDHSIRALINANQSLSYQVSQLTSQVTALLSIQTSGSNQPHGEATSLESHCTDPEPFCGEPNCCRGFLFQCSAVFQQRPKQFCTDSARIHYMCGLMRGKALQWAEAKFSRNRVENTTYNQFVNELKLVFDHPDYNLNSSLRLMKLNQGERAVSDYTIEFWTLAADVSWTEDALRAAFINGLNEQLKDELASREEPPDLQSLVSLINRIDNCCQTRRRERTSSTRPITKRPQRRYVTSPSALPLPAPFSTRSASPPLMQFGRARLTSEEKQRRQLAGLCLYCGDKGHYLANCPVRPKDRTHQ
uniref:CCHC-type domain-containing protein n=1 Tax=Oryzias melastigma TaxID=30732 RepID=A0A3B3C5A7_ORYME